MQKRTNAPLKLQSSCFTLACHQQGMAILMVMMAIALLSFILADFTYETKLNKIKTYNLQDKTQARLNAEAGLKLALAKLKIYQKARNEIEKQKQLKEMIKMSDLEAVVTMPFIYPLPIPPKAGAIQREAIQEFISKTILKGQLSLQMTPVRGFYNPNNLRISKDQKSSNDQNNSNSDPRDSDDQSDNQNGEKTPQAFLEEELVTLLKTAIETKREQDEQFDLLYGQTEAALLIKELRFFVSDPGTYDDPSVPEFEANYAQKGITPKHAPLTSLDELYLLVGWSDAIIDLIKDKLSVHEAAFIPLNEITHEQLQALFPNMTPEQSEEFFRFRDGSKELKQDPHPFGSIEDFKRLVINELNIIDNAGYEERIKQFEKAGIKLGLSGKLFKVSSIGKVGNAQYSLVAFVDMPIRPLPPQQNQNNNTNNPNNDPNNPNNEPNGDPNNFNDPNNPSAGQGNNQNQNKEPPPMQLLAPRIVELRHE